MKVFISGSISIKTLPQPVYEILDKIMSKKMSVLVGDANGIDSAVQEYLNSRNYRAVTVYTVNRDCRNNIGDWPVCRVEPDSAVHFKTKFTQKDIAMTLAADYGFAIWDESSKGTMANIERLIENDKKVKVFLSNHSKFVCLSKTEDLALLNSASFENLQQTCLAI